MYPTDAADYEQSARQPRQAAAQRRQLRVRAREQLGPGPGLPLRLPGPAAPRDHPGAAGARVRPRHRHHRPLGGLSRAPERRRRCWSCTTPPTIPDPTRIDHVEEPWIKATILVPDEFLGGDPAALHREARRAAGADLCRQPGDGRLSPAAERGRLRFLRPAEVDQPRLRQLRLPSRRLWRERSRQARRADQRRPRRFAVDDRAPQQCGGKAAAASARNSRS